mgnify:CR=1 FL=1
MNKQILKKWLTPFLLMFIMFLGMLISSKNVLAENKNVDVNITNLSITNQEGNIPPEGFFSNSLFKLTADWDASKYGNTLREGDYFELQLPDKFKFPESSADCNFNLFTKGGDVIARAHVTPTLPGGGRVRVTFTDYVNDKHHIKGNFNLTANWNKVSYPVTAPSEHEIVIGSFHKGIIIKPDKPSPPSDHILNKYSGQTLTSEGHVRWTMIINTKQANLTNVVVKDQLSVEPPGTNDGIMYVTDTDSFTLYDLVFENGGWVRKNPRNISSQVSFSPDKRSFSYNMGNINGKAYLLFYKSTYRDGLKLKNRAELTSSSTNKVVTSEFVWANSGGSGEAVLKKINIKVLKIWKDNNDRDKKRPQNIVVKLFANGKNTGKVLVLSAANNWKGRFTDLPKYTKNGHLIKYTVKENPIANGYTGTITGDAKIGFVITNVRKPDKPPKPTTPPNPGAPPKTGDTRNLYMYLFMLLASGAFLFVSSMRKSSTK